MDFNKGLKRIVNVPFWLWIIIGVIVLFNNNAYPFLTTFFICIVLPVILRLVIFYIVDGFFNKKN